MTAANIRNALRETVQRALSEDLPSGRDVTCECLVSSAARGRGAIFARENGVLAGIEAGPEVISQLDTDLTWESTVADGQRFANGDCIAQIQGSAKALLIAERTILNILSHLSGVASKTRQFADAIAHTSCQVFDTRKTLPGLRVLQKYAVECGGGKNHRMSLSDAILIKDNHLCLGSAAVSQSPYTPATAVRMARAFCQQQPIHSRPSFVEIEVTSIDQFREVLAERPDVIMLDNMTCQELRLAVALRNKSETSVILEASGGIRLDTAADIAATGVDRISVGELTHSVRAIDFGLDW